MNYLKNSLLSVEDLKLQLQNSNFTNFKSWVKELPTLSNVIRKIDKAIDEDATLLSSGKVIKNGYSEELDKLRKISDGGKNVLLRIQNEEIEKTGISSLKIAYNKVFGYYLEVTNAHKDKVPSTWIRKQTLVNAERYITEELKEYEETILNADEKISVIERDLFFNLMEEMTDNISNLQKSSRLIAFLDCVLSFSTLALSSNLNKPLISDNKIIDIKKGRHLIIEKPFQQTSYIFLMTSS